MATIRVTYLGTLNENIENNKTVVEKHIISVKVSELSQWFQYTRDRKGGRNPFKLLDSSIIKIHERVQRGKNEAGFLLQEKNKIDDIRDTLLGINHGQKVYLGSLVWNIRKKDTNIIKKIKVSEDDNLPPKYELKIDVDNIFLTDSAHRHFGIVEAYKEYLKNRSEYRLFDENYEFSVEVYNLSATEEQNLFNELNSKQKKITAAKQKQLDNTTPLGKIKDEIIDYDMEHEKIFYNNIELNSNQNNGHTLMTMSVFVSSIKEMFKSEINDVYLNDSVNDELKDEIVKYYCDFFATLKDNIQITYTYFGEEKEVYAFNNLHQEYISPIENADYEDDILERKLDEAREQASRINKEIRKQDLITHNITIKALSRLGRLIRKMSNWKIVIEQIQQSLIVGCGGKFLQRSNVMLLEKYKNNKEALITINEDGSPNMQVVSWKVDDLYNFFINELKLKKESKLYFGQDGFIQKLSSETTLQVSKTNQTTIQFRYDFYIADLLFDEISLDDLSISITALDNWSKIKFVGKKSFQAIRKEYDEGFVDEVYDSGIKKVSAYFEIILPGFEEESHISSGLKLKVRAFSLSINSEEEFTFKTIEA